MNRFAIISVKIFFICVLFLLSASCKSSENVVQSESGNTEENEVGEVKEGDVKESEVKEESKKELPPPTAKEIGYAFGAIVARAAEMNHIEVDAGALYKGFKDNSGEEKIDMEKYDGILRRAFMEGKKKYAAENLKKEEAFLEENKTKEGVVVLESGLQYKVLKKGDENSKQPTKDSKVKIVYEGIALGQESNFDSSNGEAVEIPLQGVILGWQEIVPMMHIGDQFEVYIPAKLAYREEGATDYQGREIIPPNALLIFKIELKEIVEPEKEDDDSQGSVGGIGTSESDN